VESIHSLGFLFFSWITAFKLLLVAFAKLVLPHERRNIHGVTKWGGAHHFKPLVARAAVGWPGKKMVVDDFSSV